MSEPANGANRILVLAPTGRDSEVLEAVLGDAGLDVRPCESMPELCAEVETGAGLAVVSGEALTPQDRTRLETTLSNQPEWSDFPLIIMASQDHEVGLGWAFARDTQVSHGLILERPVRATTLLSAVRAALRSRSRQYQIRDELLERRRVERELRQSAERKNEFIAMLGHELRNPLASIRHACEVFGLHQARIPALGRAYDVLDRQSRQMGRLVDGLLEVSRVSRGKVRLQCRRIDLRQVLDQVVEDRRVETSKRGLVVTREMPSREVWVDGDPVRLAQVFDNLLGNAVKFTPATGSIVVRIAIESDRAQVAIRDSGPGIRPELLARIFEPFEQEAQPGERAAGGLGLGLAVAKGFVELHGGTIRATSAGAGAGAEFCVALPRAPAPRPRSDVEPRHRAPPRRMLLVEDNTDAAEMLRLLLAARGHRVRVAESGPRALESLRDEPADVVLCDIGLPGMSGYDVARRVHHDPGIETPALVALTGYGQPEDRQRALDAGFDAHLTKPVDLVELESVLATVVD